MKSCWLGKNGGQAGICSGIKTYAQHQDLAQVVLSIIAGVAYKQMQRACALSVKTIRPAKKDRAAPAWPKKATKKGFHTPSRDKAGAPRRHYLVTTVTPAEKEAILKYCDKHGRSISSFLADIALEDARQPAKSKLEDQEITLTLRLPARDIDKMRLFARLEQKSVEELLREFLQPGLQKRKAVAAVPMHTLRCWLSDDEHKTIKEYLADYGLSARSYLALLALKVINRC